MGRLHGKGGKVTAGGNDVAAVVSWEITQNADEVEATAMGDDAKVYLAGFDEWTVSGEFMIESSGDSGQQTIKTGDTVAMEFFVDGTMKYSGNVVVLEVKVASSVSSIVKGTFSGRGTGALQDGVLS